MIWIKSLREKAVMIESMLQNLQGLTVKLKRSQQQQLFQQNSSSVDSINSNYDDTGSAPVAAAAPLKPSSASERRDTEVLPSVGGDAETEAIVAQIAELEASVNSMRAMLLLVCRGRLMDKQIRNVFARGRPTLALRLHHANNNYFQKPFYL